MSTVNTAIIIGGGIAGLSLARVLRRQGISVSVFEQAPALKDGGVGLTLWSNGLNALRLIDETIVPAILSNGKTVESFRFLNSAGELLGAVNLDHLNRLAGEPSLMILRSKLMAALSDGVQVHYNKRFVQYKYVDNAPGVAAYFEDGTCYEADILIGADGFNSPVLAQLGQHPQPVYAGYTCYRGSTTVAADTMPQGALWQLNGVGSQFGLMHVSDKQVAWYATANMPSHVIEAADERKHYLLSRFAEWSKPIGAVLAATDSKAILKNDIYHRDVIYDWHQGPVLVIGDAAHATTPNLGQGACMALEDSAILARCLTVGGSVEQIFKRFVERRSRRTAFVVRTSKRSGTLMQSENSLILKNRDRLLKMMLKGGKIPALEKIIAYR